MTGNIRIALIGAGGIGRRWAFAVEKSRGVKLVFVCDHDRAKANEIARHFPGCATSERWEDGVASSEVDAAIIALPHAFLAPASLSFLERGKHVLCEKPAGIDPAEIKRVMRIARKSGARYMVGFNHRFHDGFQKAKKLFDKGAIGDILFIRARYGFGGRAGYAKEWRFHREISRGGELIDQGVHMIDLARWFLGDFTHVQGFVEDMFWNGGVEDNAFLLLKNKKRRVASVHVSWTQWNPLHVFEIYGTKGYLIVRGLGKKYGGDERLIFGQRDVSFKNAPLEKTISCDSDADMSLVRELEEFLSAIRERRGPQPNGNDAFEVL